MCPEILALEGARAAAERARGRARHPETTTPPSDRGCLSGGRCRTRTDDLFGVNEARYQLRQSPATIHLAIPWTPFSLTRARCVTWVCLGFARRARSGNVMGHRESGANADVAQLVAHHLAKVRVASSSLVIRSRSPDPSDGSHHGGVAERRGNGLQSRVHRFESGRHLAGHQGRT